MTQEKMLAINQWMKQINNGMQLELEEQMIISNATLEMLKKIEPIYDKYNMTIILEKGKNR